MGKVKVREREENGRGELGSREKDEKREATEG